MKSRSICSQEPRCSRKRIWIVNFSCRDWIIDWWLPVRSVYRCCPRWYIWSMLKDYWAAIRRQVLLTSPHKPWLHSQQTTAVWQYFFLFYFYFYFPISHLGYWWKQTQRAAVLVPGLWTCSGRCVVSTSTWIPTSVSDSTRWETRWPHWRARRTSTTSRTWTRSTWQTSQMRTKPTPCHPPSTWSVIIDFCCLSSFTTTLFLSLRYDKLQLCSFQMWTLMHKTQDFKLIASVNAESAF